MILQGKISCGIVGGCERMWSLGKDFMRRVDSFLIAFDVLTFMVVDLVVVFALIPV